MTLADRIVVLNGGRIEQTCTPMQLCNYPANTFFAGFIGSPAINFVDIKRAGLKTAVADAVKVGIRPETISVEADTATANAATDVLCGTVSPVEQLCGDTNLYLDCGQAGLLCIRLFDEHSFTINSRMIARIDKTKLHFFDEKGNAILY